MPSAAQLGGKALLPSSVPVGNCNSNWTELALISLYHTSHPATQQPSQPPVGVSKQPLANLISFPNFYRNGRQPNWKKRKSKTTKLEDDQAGRWPNWKMTKMEDDQTGRWPNWKMTKLEDDITERWPNWKTAKLEGDQTGRRPDWKTNKLEDDQIGRWPNWKTAKLEFHQNGKLTKSKRTKRKNWRPNQNISDQINSNWLNTT